MILKCPYCGVEVETWSDPVTERLDPADERSLAAFVIISDNRLAHRCELADD